MIKYTKKITAFIDVLGFSDIVFQSTTTQIDSYFSFLQKKINKISKSRNITSYYISDSIILIADDNENNLKKLIGLVYYIQASLLEINILVRGAITVGKIYLNKSKNIIVGPSLIDSFQLEKEAKFPRVIVDRQIIKHYNHTSTSSFLRSINQNEVYNSGVISAIVKEDVDSCLYVNYLSYLFSRHQNFTPKRNITNLYEMIQSSYLNNLHLDKYSWLKTKCIEELSKQIDWESCLQSDKPSTRKSRNKKIRHLPVWLNKFLDI